MIVNGEKINVDGEIVLSEFLRKQNYSEERVAVEKNGNIVPKKDFKQTKLSSQDKLEIVSFVGGG
ncbi:MAG: sulfur carrier protein ThiS [Oscillospiraceae bacterium]|nr:sulfur carrier protein ThiS [Oscillospiraceae bacterium]